MFLELRVYENRMREKEWKQHLLGNLQIRIALEQNGNVSNSDGQGRGGD